MKKHPKKLPKPCPNHEKIDEKIVSFFDVALFAFWPRFGRISGSLGHSWAPLGRLLGVPWALLGVSGAPLGSLGRLVSASWAIWGRFWRGSGMVWEGFGWGQELKITFFSYLKQAFRSTPNAGH